MFCNLKSYQSIQLRTLNPYRGSKLLSLPFEENSLHPLSLLKLSHHESHMYGLLKISTNGIPPSFCYQLVLGWNLIGISGCSLFVH